MYLALGKKNSKEIFLIAKHNPEAQQLTCFFHCWKTSASIFLPPQVCLILLSNKSPLNKYARNFSWHQTEFGNAGVSVTQDVTYMVCWQITFPGSQKLKVPLEGKRSGRRGCATMNESQQKKKKSTRLKNAGVDI